MSDKELEMEIIRNIRSASTLTSVGLLGLFFPIIAWVCCGIALSRLSDARALMEDNDKLFDKYIQRVKDKHSSASFLILVAILVALAWFFYAVTNS